MAVTNKARFTINGTASTTLGFDAAPGATLTFQLESAVDVYSVRYQVYDPADPESPLASSGAPQLLFSNTLPMIAPAVPANAVTAAMFSSPIDGHSWIVRCTAVTSNGEQVFERMVCLKTNKPRKYVPGEVTQYSARGWGDQISELVAAFNPYHIPALKTTSDAVLQSWFDVPQFPRGCALFVSGEVQVVQANTPNNSIVWFFEGGYAVDAANVLTQRIAPSIVRKRDLSAGALLALDPSFSIVGNRLRGSVQGVAATTLYWTARMDFFLGTSL